MAEATKKKHFVLVHGLGHGAWTWYKVKPRLESSGHRVTVLDLEASGINIKAIEDVHTLHEYTKPLLEILGSLASNEKVILVGHSLGGLNLALAAENFPDKISVAVYLTAFLPDTVNQPSYLWDQLVGRTPEAEWLDTQFRPYGSSNQSFTSLTFGPKFLSSKLYQLSSIEDVELGKALVRPGSFFLSDLSKANMFSNDRYGSVTRVYILCNEDSALTEEFQRWMIKNYEVKEVMEIKGADHMPMFSKPQELCEYLSQIANKYA